MFNYKLNRLPALKLRFTNSRNRVIASRVNHRFWQPWFPFRWKARYFLTALFTAWSTIADTASTLITFAQPRLRATVAFELTTVGRLLKLTTADDVVTLLRQRHRMFFALQTVYKTLFWNLPCASTRSVLQSSARRAYRYLLQLDRLLAQSPSFQSRQSQLASLRYFWHSRVPLPRPRPLWARVYNQPEIDSSRYTRVVPFRSLPVSDALVFWHAALRCNINATSDWSMRNARWLALLNRQLVKFYPARAADAMLGLFVSPFMLLSYRADVPVTLAQALLTCATVIPVIYADRRFVLLSAGFARARNYGR